MIGALAIATGIAPSVLWAEEPEDLATLALLLEKQAAAARR